MPDEVASQTSAGAAPTRPDDPRPPRHIVLLTDGTGNGWQGPQTNVWRVYEALDLTDPSDLKEPRQFAFYDDGVGNSSFRPLAILGGAIGFGLARNVRDFTPFSAGHGAPATGSTPSASAAAPSLFGRCVGLVTAGDRALRRQRGGVHRRVLAASAHTGGATRPP